MKTKHDNSKWKCIVKTKEEKTHKLICCAIGRPCSSQTAVQFAHFIFFSRKMNAFFSGDVDVKDFFLYEQFCSVVKEFMFLLYGNWKKEKNPVQMTVMKWIIVEGFFLINWRILSNVNMIYRCKSNTSAEGNKNQTEFKSTSTNIFWHAN